VCVKAGSNSTEFDLNLVMIGLQRKEKAACFG